MLYTTIQPCWGHLCSFCCCLQHRRSACTCVQQRTTRLLVVVDSMTTIRFEVNLEQHRTTHDTTSVAHFCPGQSCCLCMPHSNQPCWLLAIDMNAGNRPALTHTTNQLAMSLHTPKQPQSVNKPNMKHGIGKVHQRTYVIFYC